MNIRTIEKIIEKYKRDYFKVKQIEKFIKIYYFIKFSKIEVCVKLKEKEELILKSSDSSIIVKRRDECIHKRLVYLQRMIEVPQKKFTNDVRFKFKLE